MPSLIACELVLIALAAAAPEAPQALRNVTIESVAWIAGTWIGGEGSLRLEERWTPPAGGAMLAVSRTLNGETMTAFEYLRIVERGGTLLYIAQPQGRPPTEFTLTKLDAGSARFENPAHDFPKVITYRRRPGGALEATVAGERGAGAQTFVFRRQE
jgi:hypothetical protein